MRQPGSESGFAPEMKTKTETEPVSFEFLPNPELRHELRVRTEAIVERVQREEIDIVIFLDKSARPISWLFSELWKQRAGNIPLPGIKFLNLGVGHHERDRLLDDARVLKEEEDFKPELGTITDVQQVFGTQFDHKSVLIVDELSGSGATERAALELIRSAFPEVSQVASEHLFNMHDAQKFFTWPWRFPWGGDAYQTVGVFDVDDEILTRPFNSESARVMAGKKYDELWQQMQDAASDNTDGMLRAAKWHLEFLQKTRVSKSLQKHAETEALDDALALRNKIIASAGQYESVLHRLCVEEKTPEEKLKLLLALNILSEQWKQTHFMLQRLGNRTKQLSWKKDLHQLSVVFLKMSDSLKGAQFQDGKLNQDVQKYILFDDLANDQDTCREWRKQALQLRAEMKAIAQEKTD